MKQPCPVLVIAVFILFSIPAPTAALDLIFEDPIGDNHGAGGIRFPSDPMFVPGTFDLTAIRTRTTSRAIEIEAEFAAVIQKPPAGRMVSEHASLSQLCRHGFFLQTIDLYLDYRELNDNLSWLLPGRKAIAAQPGWDRAVILCPQPELTRTLTLHALQRERRTRTRSLHRSDRQKVVNREVRQFLDQHILFPTQISVRGRRITAQIPRRRLHPITMDTRLLVIITAAQWQPISPLSFSPPGRWEERPAILIHPINIIGGPLAFGGAEGWLNEPPILDLLAPADNLQEAVLQQFTPGGDDYVILPFISAAR